MALTELTVAALFGLLAAISSLWWLSRHKETVKPIHSGREQALSFLFEGPELIDVSREGDALLATADTGTSLPEVLRLFRNRFQLPDAEQLVPQGDETARFDSANPEDQSVLQVSRIGKKTRITLKSDTGSDTASSHKLYLAQSELAILRQANALTPCPIWQQGDDGHLVWWNDAYEKLYLSIYREPPSPDEPLFKIQADLKTNTRLSIDPGNGKPPVWYDVSQEVTDSGRFFTAIDSNAVVHAELAQRNFVQTLAKTFAHLSIGLAIFNENRQLILFNPSLIDLTGLGAEFLSGRPYLLSFFDELRDKRSMPEPKNYNSWRQQIADLVAAASDGRYSEVWTLENGRTYRVDGRPHPDGAIAFLFEDISAEVSLTRRFRAELELGQSVIDNLDSGIVVFSSSGVLTISNNTYSEMWGVDPENSFADVTIVDCMRDWQESSAPSPTWGELRDFVLDFQDRTSWSASVPGPDGTTLECDVVPLSSGATMVRFQQSQSSSQDEHLEALQTSN